VTDTDVEGEGEEGVKSKLLVAVGDSLYSDVWILSWPRKECARWVNNNRRQERLRRDCARAGTMHHQRNATMGNGGWTGDG
jgi:hypothetical protein